MIHLRVASPPDVTGVLMPMLRSEPTVMNLTVLPGAVSHPDGDAVHFDVLHGSANEVIGQLSDLGLDRRGSIVLENVDTSISVLTAVAIAGLPVQRAIWRRAARRAALSELQKTGG